MKKKILGLLFLVVAVGSIYYVSTYNGTSHTIVSSIYNNKVVS